MAFSRGLGRSLVFWGFLFLPGGGGEGVSCGLLLVLKYVAVILLTCFGWITQPPWEFCKHVMQLNALPLLLYSLYVIVF